MGSILFGSIRRHFLSGVDNGGFGWIGYFGRVGSAGWFGPFTGREG